MINELAKFSIINFSLIRLMTLEQEKQIDFRISKLRQPHIKLSKPWQNVE